VIDACAYPSHPPPVAVPLRVLPAHDCPYLPGRVAQMRGFRCKEVAGEVYHDFMDRGFRRSGDFFYQPVCPGCRECRPLRVPTATFTPSKSQRRVRRRNADVSVTVTPDPRPRDEAFELYFRYQRDHHGVTESTQESAEKFAEFLYTNAVDTLEFAYRDRAGRLIGVGIADFCPQSLSSVYFFFDPDQRRRSLGVFGALWEIDFARSGGIPYYYLGYWIRGCARMRYKADFAPHELLDPDGAWRGSADACDAPMEPHRPAAPSPSASSSAPLSPPPQPPSASLPPGLNLPARPG
jgi:arginine-tRNA-protein transferase